MGATSLLIELQQPFSLDTISLPADPNSAARGMGAPGGAAGGKPGASAFLPGFMASLAAAPHGASMLNNARSADGFSPYQGLLSRLGAGSQGSLHDFSFEDLAGAFAS